MFTTKKKQKKLQATSTKTMVYQIYLEPKHHNTVSIGQEICNTQRGRPSAGSGAQCLQNERFQEKETLQLDASFPIFQVFFFV